MSAGAPPSPPPPVLSLSHPLSLSLSFEWTGRRPTMAAPICSALARIRRLPPGMGCPAPDLLIPASVCALALAPPSPNPAAALAGGRRLLCSFRVHGDRAGALERGALTYSATHAAPAPVWAANPQALHQPARSGPRVPKAFGV